MVYRIYLGKYSFWIEFLREEMTNRLRVFWFAIRKGGNQHKGGQKQGKTMFYYNIFTGVKHGDRA